MDSLDNTVIFTTEVITTVITVEFEEGAQQPKFICEICGNWLTTKSNLQVHLNTVHNGLKPFRCNFCQQSFGESGTLKVFKMKKKISLLQVKL